MLGAVASPHVGGLRKKNPAHAERQKGAEGTADMPTARERRAVVLKHAVESHVALTCTARCPPSGTPLTILRDRGQLVLFARRKQMAGALTGYGLRTDASACTIQVLRREVWEMETASASTEQERPGYG